MAVIVDTEPSAAPALPIAVGELVAGKYRIERLVGLGGMAAVMAGKHVELDQPIAVKLLLPERASEPDAVRRFLTEARAAAKLNGPHVARISDVGTTPTSGGPILPFIVMELLEGSDLASVLVQRGKLPAADAIAYVRQACDAIAEAHALGIVHRDVKPANLFLTHARETERVVKLLDFGISKTITHGRATDRRLTNDRETMGSPPYMSPEQVRGDEDVDHRTDIWSLGVVLQELVTGVEAFEGGSVNEIFVSILDKPPRSIAKLAPEAPAEVSRIVSRCLQKSAGRRFQTIGELSAALAACQLPAEQAGPSAPTPEVRRSKRRHVFGMLAGALILATGIAVAAMRAGAKAPEATAIANVNEAPTATTAPAGEPKAVVPPAEGSEAIDLDVAPVPSPSAPRPRAKHGTPKAQPPHPQRHRTDW